MLTRLLVPWDGSEESAAAFAPAATLAKATGATVTVLRVVHPSGALDPTAERARTADALAEVSLDLAESGAHLQSDVRAGEPAAEILDEAERIAADLIVMATHGRAGLGRAILGSVAERVLSHSPVPVLLVTPGGHVATGLRTLVVPIDGTPGGAMALSAATGLARVFGARLVLVTVTVPSSAYAWPYAGFAYYDPSWDEDARAAGQEYVDAVAARLRRAGVDAEGRSVLGSVSGTIDAIADDVDADLIVMSTHALTGPARAIVGSVADAVVRGSHRPVLLLRRTAPLSAALVDDRGLRATA